MKWRPNIIAPGNLRVPLETTKWAQTALIMTVTTSFPTWSSLGPESRPQPWLNLSLSLQHFLCFSGLYLISKKRAKGVWWLSTVPLQMLVTVPWNVCFDIISCWCGFLFRDWVLKWPDYLREKEGKVHHLISHRFSVIVKNLGQRYWQWT